MFKRLVLFVSLLLITSDVVHGSLSLIKSSCTATLYPHLCYSTLSSTIPPTTTATKKDLIQLTINKTKDTIQSSLNTINHLATNANLTNRAKAALHDCLELGAETLRRIDMVIQDLKTYPTTKPLRPRHADDLKTFMSTAITNKETCLDGLSHDAPSKLLRKSIFKGQDRGGKMCSNVLAMIKNMTESDMASDVKIKMVKGEEIMWPEWLSAGDRKLSNTIITASESVAGGNTTFNSATVAAVGDGFLARDITFQNAAGPSGEQAVALRVGSDLSAFYRCGILAYQDTLYVHSNRQFYYSCMVVGTVDFIFGNAAVVLQDCDIQARLPGPKQKNMLTAQGRTDPNQNTGIVIQKCRIAATSDLQPVQGSYPTYLGRPWKLYSRTVVMQSSITDVINPAGWYPWDGDFALDTLYYREYKNTGVGADTSKRVTWPGWGVFTSDAEAQSFTPGSFIDGGSWLQSTGFPYSLGL
ncbi:putative pectinesterase [Helianthus annuus]|nr:putative pectinesterase [Helianthus annuus]KAJ0755745.1 putative pectinesterase [Helianthus annuus]